MKKLFAHISLLLFVLASQSGTVFAQNTVNAFGVVQSGEPVTRTGGSGATGTATGTKPGSLAGNGGQPGTTTRGGLVPVTTTTGGQTASVPPATDIPLVPISTQQTTPVGQTDQTNMVCNQDRCQAAISQASGNEIIVMTILMLGSLVGGLLWILSLKMSQKGFIQREIHRLDRENRVHFEKTLMEVKNKVYNNYIDSVMNVFSKMDQKHTLSAEDIATFNQGSVLIKLHGSKPLCALDEHIGSLLQSGKPLTSTDQNRLKSDLTKLIRADLLKVHPAAQNDSILRKRSANFV